jgi:hypothetical protein
MKHAIGLCALLVAASASAADLPCGPAEKGTVQLDGLVDDWNEVDGLDAGGKDANASFTIKCNVEDGKTLLLVVDVRDNYMVRTRPGHPGEDHLSLSFNGHPLLVYPGNARDIPTVARWGSKPAKLKAVSALQERGWAVELAIPLATIPGYRAGMPIAFDGQFADSDSKVQLKTERTVGVSGNLVFNDAGGGGGQLDAFLNDRKLGHGDVWFDQNAHLGGKTGARVVLAGRYIGFITDGYVFTELPVKARADVKDARLLDLAGDGRQAVVVRYAERGDGYGHEVLAVYRLLGDSDIRRVFAAEVGKSIDKGRVENKVAFIKRGRANDIVIDATRAEGASAASWPEPPPGDIIPVLLPWATTPDGRHARYQFSGDEYKRSQ